MKEWISGLLVAALAALAPIKAVMITVGFLIFADLVTGVWAAHKRGEKISSAALRRTISKIVIYQLAVISGFLVETHLIESFMPICKIVAGAIGMVELTSMLENSNSIVGGNIFSSVVKKLGSENDPNNKPPQE